MKKSYLLVALSTLVLAGCSANEAKQKHSSEDSKAKVAESYDKKAKKSNSSSDTGTKQSKSKNEQVNSSIWNDDKSKKLSEFMQQWGTTMKQSYTEYPKGSELKIDKFNIPSDILRKKNGFTEFEMDSQAAKLEWFNGKESNDGTYQLLTVYSDLPQDSKDADPLSYHNYFFMLLNGQPVVGYGNLFQGQGDHQPLIFKQTDNQELKNGFQGVIDNSSTEKTENASTEESKTDEKAQSDFSPEELATAVYLYPGITTSNVSTEETIDRYIASYDDSSNTAKLQISKRLLPDIVISESSMETSQTIHFEGDTITAKGRTDEKTYSAKELTQKFEKYKDKLDLLVSKAENYSPLKNSTSSESSSDTDVDTKNLTSSQLKEWVGAVLDEQFSQGRKSFQYGLSIENHDGYAYVRVENQEIQMDAVTMFRINSDGELEEEDLSNGYPATYNVVSSKFMDTSEVTAPSTTTSSVDNESDE